SAFSIATPPLSNSTLSLHDALPIFFILWRINREPIGRCRQFVITYPLCRLFFQRINPVVPHSIRKLFFLPPGDTFGQVVFKCLRSEEHTSELQSRENLVCRLLLEKK